MNGETEKGAPGRDMWKAPRTIERQETQRENREDTLGDYPEIDENTMDIPLAETKKDLPTTKEGMRALLMEAPSIDFKGLQQPELVPPKPDLDRTAEDEADARKVLGVQGRFISSMARFAKTRTGKAVQALGLLLGIKASQEGVSWAKEQHEQSQEASQMVDLLRDEIQDFHNKGMHEHSPEEAAEHDLVKQFVDISFADVEYSKTDSFGNALGNANKITEEAGRNVPRTLVEEHLESVKARLHESTDKIQDTFGESAVEVAEKIARYKEAPHLNRTEAIDQALAEVYGSEEEARIMHGVMTNAGMSEVDICNQAMLLQGDVAAVRQYSIVLDNAKGDTARIPDLAKALDMFGTKQDELSPKEQPNGYYDVAGMPDNLTGQEVRLRGEMLNGSLIHSVDGQNIKFHDALYTTDTNIHSATLQENAYDYASSLTNDIIKATDLSHQPEAKQDEIKDAVRNLIDAELDLKGAGVETFTSIAGYEAGNLPPEVFAAKMESLEEAQEAADLSVKIFKAVVHGNAELEHMADQMISSHEADVERLTGGAKTVGLKVE